MNQTNLIVSSTGDWTHSVTSEVGSAVQSYLSRTGKCTLALTGGASAERLYRYWAKNPPWDHKKVVYFFGDERCVPPLHQESNYGMVMRNLFASDLPQGVTLNRMETEKETVSAAVKRYEQLLPDSIDVLLLGLGPDGHIASLFPYDDAVREQYRTVLPVEGPKLPKKRWTITPPVIKQAQSTFLLATGEVKGETLRQALERPDDIESMPVRLVLHTNWLLDEDAATPVLDILKKTN